MTIVLLFNVLNNNNYSMYIKKNSMLLNLAKPNSLVKFILLRTKNADENCLWNDWCFFFNFQRKKPCLFNFFCLSNTPLKVKLKIVRIIWNNQSRINNNSQKIWEILKCAEHIDLMNGYWKHIKIFIVNNFGRYLQKNGIVLLITERANYNFKFPLYLRYILSLVKIY